MKVELYYFEGCPNHKPALACVQSVLIEQGIAAEVTEIEVPERGNRQGCGLSRLSYYPR